VKGYEYEKGKYVVLKDEDFERVDLEATQTVDIQDFVDVDEIDPMFFYDTEKLHVPKKVEVGKREMNMAKSLIDSMSSKWNPQKYRDDYREALMEVIEEKVEAGGKEIEEKPRRAPKPTKVIDLVSVLQKSLEETGAKRKTTGKSRKKPRPPAKKAA